MEPTSPSLASISDTLYRRWSKDFVEDGKSRLMGDSNQQSNSTQVKTLRQGNMQLEQFGAKWVLTRKVLKESSPGMEATSDEGETCAARIAVVHRSQGQSIELIHLALPHTFSNDSSKA